MLRRPRHLINSAAALDAHDYDQRSLKQHANEGSRCGDKGPINGTLLLRGTHVHSQLDVNIRARCSRFSFLLTAIRVFCLIITYFDRFRELCSDSSTLVRHNHRS